MSTQYAVDTNLYFVKSGLTGSVWRTPHITREQAMEKAKWFVREWMNIGVQATAIVFYRDGSIVCTITAKDL